MHDMKRTLPTLALTLALLLAALFCVSAGAVEGGHPTSVFARAETDVSWDDGWQTMDGEPLYLPLSLEGGEAGFTMQKGLPTKLPEHAVIAVSTSYLPVAAKVNGEPVPVSGTFMPGICGITYANARSLIAIPSDAGGQTLTLTLYPAGSKPTAELYGLELGGASTLRAQSLLSGERLNLFGVVLLAIALGLLIIAALLAVRRVERGRADFMAASLFLFLSGVWFLVDGGENTLRFGASGSYLFVNLFSFLLLASPLLLYMRNNCGVGRRVLLALALLPVLQTAVVLLLLLFGRFDLSVTLSVSHVITLVSILVVIVCLGIELFYRKNRRIFTMFCSMLSLSVTGLATMVSFYFFCSPDNTSVFRYGVAVFALFIAARTVSQAVSVIVEARSIDSLRYAADHDALTGLYNASAFHRETRVLLERHPSRRYLIGCFDFEKFRLINDVFGREQGDQLLRFTARTLESLMRGKGTYARLESDKFLFCLPQEKQSAERLCEQLQRRIAAYPLDYVITLSFGLYALDDPKMPVAAMVDRASTARAKVKGNYVSRVAYYDDTLRRTMLYEQSIVNAIDAALSEEQLYMALQPKYELASGALIGAEALVRWNHPVMGAISPGDFVPILEKNGLILRVDEYIWERACKTLADWMARFGEANTPPISVNVSRLHIFRANLTETIKGIAARYGVPPRLLPLEITESAYSEAPELLTRITDELHAAGFQIHMDDFGSGYSSLNMLKSVDVDVLKLDMLFLFGESEHARSTGILKAVIDMAQAMGIYVVAEGVETEAQATLLKRLGCRGAQGFLYCKPVPVDTMTGMLEGREKGFA